jgi:hypothetical protein
MFYVLRQTAQGFQNVLLPDLQGPFNFLSEHQFSGHAAARQGRTAAVGDERAGAHLAAADLQPELHGIPTGSGDAGVPIAPGQPAVVAWV